MYRVTSSGFGQRERVSTTRDRTREPAPTTGGGGVWDFVSKTFSIPQNSDDWARVIGKGGKAVTKVGVAAIERATTSRTSPSGGVVPATTWATVPVAPAPVYTPALAPVYAPPGMMQPLPKRGMPTWGWALIAGGAGVLLLGGLYVVSKRRAVA